MLSRLAEEQETLVDIGEKFSNCSVFHSLILVRKSAEVLGLWNMKTVTPINIVRGSEIRTAHVGEGITKYFFEGGRNISITTLSQLYVSYVRADRIGGKIKLKGHYNFFLYLWGNPVHLLICPPLSEVPLDQIAE